MAGPKQIKNVIICPENCCDGYHEEYAQVPYTGLVVWCERDTPRRVSIIAHGQLPRSNKWQ